MYFKLNDVPQTESQLTAVRTSALNLQPKSQLILHSDQSGHWTNQILVVSYRVRDGGQ